MKLFVPMVKPVFNGDFSSLPMLADLIEERGGIDAFALAKNLRTGKPTLQNLIDVFTKFGDKHQRKVVAKAMRNALKPFKRIKSRILKLRHTNFLTGSQSLALKQVLEKL